MTLLEGIFIVAGFVCICLSFFIARKSGMEGETEQMGSGVSASVWTEQDEKIIQERVEQLLEERQAELVDETEDKMNRLCNEKIMAMDEFSQQILEKIDSNHQEVVFMYNMLSEKQKEIKDTMAQSVKQTQAAGKTEEKRPTAETERKEKTAHSGKAGVERAAKENSNAVKLSSEKAAAKTSNQKKTVSAVAALEARKKHQEKGEQRPVAETKEERDVKIPGNVNLQIQKMYKQGKSILEISKALNIGQGEVKLVIALYGGRK